jgi:hypothetical protein
MQILDIPQGEPDWFEARAGIPTASEFHRFITPARGQYAKQADTYIAKLIVESVLGPSEAMSTFYMDRGTVMEDEARSEYEFRLDCDVQVPGLILNKGAGWSPDGYMPDAGGGLEVKCPKPETHVKWLMADELPDEHRPQCHGAIIVGELAWLDFISYCPGFPLLLKRVVRADYTDKVEAALQRFLKEYHDAKQRIDDQIAA